MTTAPAAAVACTGGPGPWFCCLLVNTSTKCKKQTHLAVHTSPQLAVDALNRSRKRSRKSSSAEDADFWVMLCKVGPFEEFHNAVAYFQLWTTRTRGKSKRWERGVELFQTYHEAHCLHFWYQPVALDQVVREPEEPQDIVPLLQEEDTMPPLADALDALGKYVYAEHTQVGEIRQAYEKICHLRK